MLKILVLAVFLSFFGFGCSVINDVVKKTESNTGAPNNSSPTADKSTETAAGASPCANRFYPIKDGSVKNYEMNNSLGKSTAKVAQKYTAGETSFTEDWTFDKTNLKHVWQCTNEGLIAPNQGSGLSSGNLKAEPKHVSGVTLPKDSEIQVGKTWTVVYEVKTPLPAGMGESVSTVTINNKVVSLDDEVKTPGGTFKAVKIEMDLNIETQIKGRKIPVPTIKTASWYAPEVGLVKNGNIDGKFGNATMEYVGQ